ncbi:discoidin domain-containing protein [Gluconacetobacter sacchari]|uniref:discoidin domain-containing protein n=1 Tax=Gluconacetobacter sacchari TaxID=92759 RepID=UPI0039B38F97
MMRKVYDCFTFFDEFDILELRLEELDSVVDYFVICEANETFVGKQKEMSFHQNREKFKKFLHKIIYVPVTDFPSPHDVWVREEHQRECLLRGLKAASDEDFILFSDVDEIPKAEHVASARHVDGYVRFKMDMFQYYMNLRERKNSWDACNGLQKKYIPTLDCSPSGTKSLSYARFNLDEISRHTSIPVLSVDNGGWHFTHLGGVEQLLKKFDSYSHANDPWPSKMKNVETLKSQIALGVAIWSGDRLAEYVPIDNTFPKYLLNNIEYYSKKGYIKNIYESFKDLQSMHVSLKKEFCFSVLDRNQPSPFLGGINSLQYIELSDIKSINLEYLNIMFRDKTNIGVGKRAVQSSISEWSIHQDLVMDASNVLNGTPDGRYKFHTNWEMHPWWQLDLEEVQEVGTLVIFNRLIPYDDTGYMKNRSCDLNVSVSSDGVSYTLMHDNRGKAAFGGIDGNPLIINLPKGCMIRYVKLELPGEGVLHLDQIEVYAD